MDQINTFKRNLVSKIMIFTITFSALYFIFDTYEVNYKNYMSMQTTLQNRIEHSEELKNEINDYQLKIDNLISNVYEFEDIDQAYHTIDEHPEKVIQTVLKY